VRKLQILSLAIAAFWFAACERQAEPPAQQEPLVDSAPAEESEPVISEPRPDIYAEFPLVADLSHLSDGQRRMIVLLIEASQIMDDLFWRQSYGDDYQEWLESIGVDDVRRFAEMNYGPKNSKLPNSKARPVCIRSSAETAPVSCSLCLITWNIGKNSSVRQTCCGRLPDWPNMKALQITFDCGQTRSRLANSRRAIWPGWTSSRTRSSS
jgi:hypothetical protein